MKFIQSKSMIIATSFVALTFVACTPSSSTGTDTTTTQPTSAPTTVAETMGDTQLAGSSDATASDTPFVDDAGVKTITMEAGSFYYNPSEIRVKKGEKVKIQLTAKDMMHDFNIDELNVKSAKVSEGQTTTIEFTADKVGEFEYYCSVGQHKSMGQVGKLIVE